MSRMNDHEILENRKYLFMQVQTIAQYLEKTGIKLTFDHGWHVQDEKCDVALYIYNYTFTILNTNWEYATDKKYYHHFELTKSHKKLLPKSFNNEIDYLMDLVKLNDFNNEYVKPKEMLEEKIIKPTKGIGKNKI